MARKRGFFAELQHLGQLAQKRKVQAAKAAAREQAAATRRAEQSWREAKRGRAQLAKATMAEQKATASAGGPPRPAHDRRLGPRLRA
jgi:restriction system protein